MVFTAEDAGAPRPRVPDGGRRGGRGDLMAPHAASCDLAASRAYGTVRTLRRCVL